MRAPVTAARQCNGGFQLSSFFPLQDWMLIALSVVIFHAKVTSTNLGGYLVAFGGASPALWIPT